MRLATSQEIPAIEEIYRQSREHAFRVGHIDWPEQFPNGFFEDLILNSELHCFEEGDSLVAAARLTDADNPEVWSDQSKPFLYIGKLATGDQVRGKNYIADIAIPAFAEEARSRGKIGLRLNCLADNPNLINYYKRLGFAVTGVASINSKLMDQQVVCTALEIAV